MATLDELKQTLGAVADKLDKVLAEVKTASAAQANAIAELETELANRDMAVDPAFEALVGRLKTGVEKLDALNDDKLAAADTAADAVVPSAPAPQAGVPVSG